MSVTRTEIAHGCGVTPALISYYFKDKRSLLDAVTKPLVSVYKSRFDLIFASRQDSAGKMKAVIQLLIELSCDNAFLVDAMLNGKDGDTLDGEDRLAVACFRSTITELVRDLLNDKQWRVPDASLSELAIWGMCRILGDSLRHQSALSSDPQDALQNRIDFVYETFVTGRACPAE
ncbi:TetR/AcrR family transcriptional regulator [Lichenihabitans sp. Uapishka_5]|uniref:TetR/AcrR family transcriptional regulator n=1 Tax=Lichenihabitans sp. Uapishka_5 TaxID=3037302 RepID=UPI0029E820C2|nr:TetR/AcrR family transcriptional regulator [Lichenihabitans sp. Uapishka_5]